ncbi:MAG: flagellar basal body L-ring protein FlgH [Planctomycetes bacterium]|nr:flagellar basal body L-ring protein FlgH [Planctomycetota bacterium]
MARSGKPLTARERALVRRCVVLMAGILFFSLLAAVRARSADGVWRGNLERDEWEFPEEDDWGVQSYDDQLLAARLQAKVIGTRPVYQRRKASREHDSVTIIINETTAAELASSNDLQRDAYSDMTLGSWLTPKLSGGLGTRQHGAAAGGRSPTISWDTGRRHKSDSTIERSQSLVTTLTGEVIQVQPNGYLVIEARKRVNVNGEEQTVRLTGIVNPRHMDSSSAIQAEYIMDMAVTYTGTGPMTRFDKRGWGAKVMDFVNPF